MVVKHFVLLLVMIICSYAYSFSSVYANMNSLASEEDIFSIDEFPEEEMVVLDGEWEFYWNKLYTPIDFTQDDVKQFLHIVSVPHNWDNAELSGNPMSRTGYGTYRLKMQLPSSEVGTMKALHIPSTSSAYKLWINGEERAGDGIVGKSKDTMEPSDIPKFVLFHVKQQSIELVIQISNFNQRKAGLTNAILIGEPEVISLHREERVIFRSIIVTSLVIMGLYHFSIFALRRKEYSLLFFGSTCILIAIRATILEPALAMHTLAFIDWDSKSKLEYLGASLGTLFFTMFTYTQFSEDMSKRIRNIIIASLSLYSVFVMITSVLTFTQTMLMMQIFILLTFVYLIYVYFIGIVRRRNGALLNGIAIVIMFCAILNDVLYYNGVIHTAELASVGLFLFLFVQSLMISKRYSTAFTSIEKLSSDLKKVNESLEQQVQERTAELEHSNKRLQVANEQLTELNHSRSRLFSNISHELGTPLTSIQGYIKGMLDGVVKGEKRYFKLIFEKCVYVSRILHDLRSLSDMDANQLKFEKEKIDVREYAKELYERYRFDLEKNKVTFHYRDFLDEELFVSIDPIRVEQVFINLIMNAEKFVSENGSIEFELKKMDEDHVMFKIADNGPGIKAEEVSLIFDRFYKSRNQQNHNLGAGLGLSISKEIIKHHNGNLWVESQVGEGSSFYFTLPIVTK